MVLLWFVLDLPNLSYRILEDLKQVLLHLANLYAVTSWRSGHKHSETLADRIGLCYFLFNCVLCSHELKVAYRPRGKFHLLDFHHALSSLPNDAYCPQTRPFSSREQKLSRVLCDEVLYSWGENDPSRKVIYLSSYLFEDVSPDMRDLLMDVADRCITVEFILLEDNLIYIDDDADDHINFVRCISDIENCSFKKCIPDFQVFSGFVKLWLKEMHEELSEPIQAHFAFKHNLIDSVNRIVCHLSRSFNFIMDECSSCKEDVSSLFQMIGFDTQICDMNSNSPTVGEQGFSGICSHNDHNNLEEILSPINFSVIERINLQSLSEGVIIGASYFVTPSASHITDASSDDLSMLELNVILFKGLCNILHSLDQGLLCTSDCDITTLRYLPFKCYFLLQPSDKGPMLLRRLAGLEEVLPTPDLRQFPNCSVSEEAMHTLQNSIESMELRDYNPLFYERGLHQKLNMFVERSLHVRSAGVTNLVEEDPFQFVSEENSEAGVSAQEEKIMRSTQATTESETSCVAKEWAQLINEIPKMPSPAPSISPSNLIKPISSPQGSCTQLDERTSKILERLEFPRQRQRKPPASPCAGSIVAAAQSTIAFHPLISQHVSALSRAPMRPKFQRVKRKQM